MLKTMNGKNSKTNSRESLLSDVASTTSSKTSLAEQYGESSFPVVIPDDESMDEGSPGSLMSKGQEQEYEPSDDLITPEKEDTTEVKKRKFYKYMLAGYVLICIGILCCTLLLLAGQLTVQQISMFETGIFKCIIQLFTAGSSVLILRLPWRINWQHFHIAFLAAICEYVSNACFYTASNLLPICSLQVVFAVLVIMLASVVDATLGRMNISSIICGAIASLGILLLVQPWTDNGFDLLQKAPCEIMSTFNIDNSTAVNLSTEAPNWLLDSHERPIHKVVSIVGIHIDAEITGYLLVFFGAIAVTAFYNFIQLLGQLYPIPTTILWVGATESCLSLLLAIVINHWKEPKEHWCIIFVICYVIMKVAMTFTLYFAFYFLKISHIVTTLSVSFVLVCMFQNSFLSEFYQPDTDVTEMAGTLFVAIGVMLFPCMLIMSKHNPYKIPEICEVGEEE